METAPHDCVEMKTDLDHLLEAVERVLEDLRVVTASPSIVDADQLARFYEILHAANQLLPDENLCIARGLVLSRDKRSLRRAAEALDRFLSTFP
jgi:hypothetical protein